MKKLLCVFMVGLAVAVLIGCDSTGPPLPDPTKAANAREKPLKPGEHYKDVQINITLGK